MPEQNGRTQRWSILGRLLPKDVRERIFEPAFHDLMYSWLTSPEEKRRLPFGVHAFGLYFGCTPIATARLFVRRRQLTRLGRYSLWAMGITVALLFITTQVLRTYGSYG